VTGLLRQAEDILETAAHADQSSSATFILIDRQGGLRAFDAAGWTLAGITAEFGATAVFKVRKSQEATSVEAWSGRDRCRIERQTTQPALALTPAVCHPMRLTTAPLSISAPDALDWAV